VAVGLAPIGFANKSSESALSIYPIAIGSCKIPYVLEAVMNVRYKIGQGFVKLFFK